jgi:hypothetical protein
MTALMARPFTVMSPRIGGQALAGAHVVPAHEPFFVLVALGIRAGQMRRADDDHAFRDDGSRMQPDLTGFQVDRLIGLELQIDDAGPSCRACRSPRAAWSAG